MKVYTKTGDRGDTSLFSGGRVGKHHPRIEAYGTVDELNSLLGLLSTEDLPGDVVDRIRWIQSALFSVGASRADPKSKIEADPDAWTTDALEDWIDSMDGSLDELRAFILPGGSREAALAHVARTVCRRAERRVLAVDRRDDDSLAAERTELEARVYEHCVDTGQAAVGRANFATIRDGQGAPWGTRIPLSEEVE